MPVAGWYPDPDGSPDFRYWDGRAWTAVTSPDPTAPPPGSPPTPPQPAARRRRRPGLLIGLLLLLAVAVVVAVIALRPRATGPEAGSSPSNTISSYDDGPTESPSATGSASPSASARASRSEAGPTGARPVACDQASPDQEPPPAADGRVHGGPLSFTQLGPPWIDPQATSRVPYSRDSQVQIYVLGEKLPWQASAQVGIATFAPFPGGEAATNAMLQCVLTSDFYTDVKVSLSENTVTTTTISGLRATQRDALLRFSHPELKTTGSRLRFVVVESDPVTYYFSAVPMERSDLIAQLDAATRSLTVS